MGEADRNNEEAPARIGIHPKNAHGSGLTIWSQTIAGLGGALGAGNYRRDKLGGWRWRVARGGWWQRAQ